MAGSIPCTLTVMAAFVFTLLTPLLVVGDYVCQSIYPTTGMIYPATSSQEKLIGPSCHFRGLNELGATAVQAYVYSMAMDAMQTIGREASLVVDGVTFSSLAQLFVVGFAKEESAALEDGTLDSLRVNILIANVIAAHSVDSLSAGFIFVGRYPPRTNISIINCRFEYNVLPRASLEELSHIETMLMLELAVDFTQHSILRIQANTFVTNFQIKMQLDFDFDAYRALIAARHEYSEQTGNTASGGERTLNGESLARAASVILFVHDLNISKSSRIIIVGNTFAPTVLTSITDAERPTAASYVVLFDTLLNCVDNSHVIIERNFFYPNISQEIVEFHELSYLLATFTHFTKHVMLQGNSSMQFSQNVVQGNVFLSSAFAEGEGMHDERLAPMHDFVLAAIMFDNSVIIDKWSSFVVALNVYMMSSGAVVTPSNDRTSFAVVIVATILHQDVVTLHNNSLYYVHGNTVAITFACSPNLDTSSDVVFAAFTRGIMTMTSSSVIFGCANPHPHPLRETRAHISSKSTYSSVFELTIGDEAAHKFNGKLFNASNYVQNAVEDASAPQGDLVFILTNDTLLGKTAGDWATISFDKCYVNYVRLFAFKIDETGPSKITISFITITSGVFLAANNSIFLCARNVVQHFARSSFLDTGTSLILVYLIEASAEGAVTGIPFRSQFIVAETLATIAPVLDTPSSSILPSKIALPSFAAVVDNEVTREWDNEVGRGFSFITIIATNGIWLKGRRSALLIENNSALIFAHPPSFFHMKTHSRGANFSALEVRGLSSAVSESAFISMDPASPYYDPFYIIKNVSDGVIPVISIQDTYFANPEGNIYVNRNDLAIFNQPLSYTADVSKLSIIEFFGYKNVNADQRPHNKYESYWKSLEEESSAMLLENNMTVPFFDRSYAFDAQYNYSLVHRDVDGAPLTFPMRRGPPLFRSLDWDSYTHFKEDSTFRGSRVQREVSPVGHTILLKNKTFLSEIIPWFNSLGIHYCQGVMNRKDVTFREVLAGMKQIVRDDGRPPNAYKDKEHGEGFFVVNGCPLEHITAAMPTESHTLMYMYSSSTSSSTSLGDGRLSTTSATLSISVSGGRETLRFDEEQTSSMKEAQQTSSDVIGGLVGTGLSGSTSIQVSISNALLRMSDCTQDETNKKNDDDDGEESLPILVHPLRFSVMPSEPFHQERGAVVGNLAIGTLSIALVRFVFVAVIGRYLSAGEDATVIVGWPSAVVLPFVALSEGTASTATALLKSLVLPIEGGRDLGQKVENESNGREEEIESENRSADSNMTYQETALEGRKHTKMKVTTAVANGVLGLVGMGVLITIAAWWLFCLVAVLPRTHMKLRRQRHVVGGNGSCVAIFFAKSITPLYGYEFAHHSRHSAAIKDLGPPLHHQRLEESFAFASLGESNKNDNHSRAKTNGSARVKERELEEFPSAAEEEELSVSSLASSSSAKSKGKPEKEVGATINDDDDVDEEMVMTAFERHSHMIGDRFVISVELLCFILAVVVGVSEGLGDEAALCKARITVAALAALVQVVLNALSTIPIDLAVQSLLGLLTATLALMAVVRVYSDGAMSAGLAEAMDLVTTVSNLVGLVAILIEVLSVGLRLFRARQKQQERHLARLKRYIASNGVEVNAVSAARGGLVKPASVYSDEEELTSVEGLARQALKAKGGGRSHGAGPSGGTTTFQVNLDDFGDDLDLFLLDVEEDAMRVDELELSLEFES